jgi:hypothetical protein
MVIWTASTNFSGDDNSVAIYLGNSTRINIIRKSSGRTTTITDICNGGTVTVTVVTDNIRESSIISIQTTITGTATAIRITDICNGGTGTATITDCNSIHTTRTTITCKATAINSSTAIRTTD